MSKSRHHSAELNGAVYYYHAHLNSTIAVTDSTASVVEQYRYDAYGQPSFFGPDGTPRAESALGLRFLFTGREWLASLALYDYRHRAYSPSLGRFLQMDPLGFGAGEVNVYGYCGNSAVSLVDPDGQEPATIGAVIAFVAFLIFNHPDTAHAPAPSDPVPETPPASIGMFADTAVMFAGGVVVERGSTLCRRGWMKGVQSHQAVKIPAAKSAAVPKQITVIGSRTDTLVAKGWPGHNVLDMPTWTAKSNIKWLDSAIRRGDEIYLATDPAKHAALLDSLPTRPFSAFTDLELPYLKWRGYVQEGVRMVPRAP